MFSHDGRTERWDTDGSNCLINLELLNISAYKEKVSSGMPATVYVCMENPATLSIGGGAFTKTACASFRGIINPKTGKRITY